MTLLAERNARDLEDALASYQPSAKRSCRHADVGDYRDAAAGLARETAIGTLIVLQLCGRLPANLIYSMKSLRGVKLECSSDLGPVIGGGSIKVEAYKLLLGLAMEMGMH